MWANVFAAPIFNDRLKGKVRRKKRLGWIEMFLVLFCTFIRETYEWRERRRCGRKEKKEQKWDREWIGKPIDDLIIVSLR